MQRTKR